MTNLSRLLSDPEQQARGYLNWLIGTGGYYYTAFVHEYNDLTAHEIKYVEKLLLSEIKSYYHSDIKGYHLVETSTRHINFHKSVQYIVKLGAVTKGKATISVQQVADKFNVILVYAIRSKYGADAGRPNTFRSRQPNLSFHKDRTIEKVKRRYKNRVVRKKGKAHLDEIELNKVHTSDTPRHKRTKRKHYK